MDYETGKMFEAVLATLERIEAKIDTLRPKSNGEQAITPPEPPRVAKKAPQKINEEELY